MTTEEREKKVPKTFPFSSDEKAIWNDLVRGERPFPGFVRSELGVTILDTFDIDYFRNKMKIYEDDIWVVSPPKVKFSH